MNILNVTPITNDSFNTTNLTGDKLRLNGLNFETTGIFNLTDSIKGRHISTINQFTFENHTFAEIHIPFSITTIGSDAFKNSDNATIYLDGRTSVPSNFDINWNSSGNPVYLNGTLCTHTSKTTIELNATQHGDLCNHCRTVTNKQNHRKYTSGEWEYCFDCSYSKHLGHTHSYTYTWLNLQEHKRSCSCGDSRTTAHIISGPWNGEGYTCIACDGPADSGLIINGVDPTSYTEDVNDHINQYFGNESFILNNGVIVLSELDLVKYYDGTLILPYECDGLHCCSNDFDEYCDYGNKFIDEISSINYKSSVVDYLPNRREDYINISQ